MSDHDEGGPSPKPTVPAALQQWREAERAVAVSQKGKQAAEAASQAAAEALTAAQATAEAAERSAHAASMAQESAGKTAKAAKLTATTTLSDATDADAELALAEAGEELAKHWYGEAQRDRAANAANSSDK